MSNVLREDIDDLNITLTVQLKADEYGPKFVQELKKLREKVKMQGFRPGKVPLSLIRKQYGASILPELLDKEINEAITGYMVDENLSFLGNPLPSEDQPVQNIDHAKLEDLAFIFNLGLPPQFELEDADMKKKFPYYEVKIDKKLIDKELENLLKRVGTRESTAEKIEENDVLEFQAKELDGKKVKEDGHQTTFLVAVKDLTEAAAKKVNGKKSGASFNFNIYELEAKGDREHVIQHLLKTDEEAAENIGEDFEMTISQVMRVKPAEPTKEVLENIFGEGRVENEEDARKLLEEDLRNHFNNQADGVLFREIQKYLLEKYEKQMPLPEDFLKRWLLSRNEKQKLTMEDLEEDFPLFTEDLRWRLIKEKLLEKFEVRITEEDVREGFRSRFRQYLGGQPIGEEIIEQMVDRGMQNQEQVENIQQEVVTEKLFEKIKEHFNTEKKSISEDKFKELQEKYLQKRG